MLVGVTDVLLGHFSGSKVGLTHWALAALDPLLDGMLFSVVPSHVHTQFLSAVESALDSNELAHLTLVEYFLRRLLLSASASPLDQQTVIVWAAECSSQHLGVEILES